MGIEKCWRCLKSVRIFQFNDLAIKNGTDIQPDWPISVLLFYLKKRFETAPLTLAHPTIFVLYWGVYERR